LGNKENHSQNGQYYVNDIVHRLYFQFLSKYMTKIVLTRFFGKSVLPQSLKGA
jgi:hypothetical protein